MYSSSVGDNEKIKKLHYDSDISFLFCVIPEMTYLLRLNYVDKQLTLGLHKVEHGITKREATYLLLFLQKSMT